MEKRKKGGNRKVPSKPAQPISTAESTSLSSSQPTDISGEPDGLTQSRLQVVGVGASAGGLEAFTELLQRLPVNTGMAFVLVQHLDPRHESVLAELLANKTTMPVRQVHDRTRVEPDSLYVIPPNKMMVIADRVLSLTPRSEGGDPHRPIDSFFASLAKELGSNAIGIVLSGTATDGTLGLKAIKSVGGITFAQDQTAKFDSMPRSAIAAGVVDFVLPPWRIAEEVGAMARDSYHRPPSQPALVEQGPTLQKLMKLIRGSTGVDFQQYKQPTIARRLTRRMVLRNAESLDRYFEILQNEPQESQALFDDLLINVTDFFRDPAVFESLKRIGFPRLVLNRKADDPVRIWVPGCSSGEEVYSVAISLLEFFSDEQLDFPIQIFGTDVSEGAISKARAGIYDSASVSALSPERLRRFFIRIDAGYQIARTVRDACVFSVHNIARDPPLSRMDVISCRNLLIYFAPALQKRVIAVFRYALKPDGCLLLGSSESLGSLADFFVALDDEHKIYCRGASIAPGTFDLSERLSSYALTRYLPLEASAPFGVGQPTPQTELQQSVDRVLSSKLGPSGVIVDDKLRIVEFRGEMGPFLGAAKVQANLKLFSVIRAELGRPLRQAIEEARKGNISVRLDKVPIRESDGLRFVETTVLPITFPGIDPHFVILFETVSLPAMGRAPSKTQPSSPKKITDAKAHVAQLERELIGAREYLQSIVEELRSTNEEAQSANEELQSANEELQTAKEELQSSNEELITINAEMQSRNLDLSQLNDDLTNLLSSMNMPIVMLGPDLRIRRFTPTSERVLHLIPADVGRPFSDLKSRINVPNVEQILRGVLDSLEPFEMDVQDQEGRSYLMRARPYRTADNRIDGAVLQLLDVADLKRSLEEVRHARDYAQAIVDTVREPLVVLDRNFTIHNANQSFNEFFHIAPPAATGRRIDEIAQGQLDLSKVHDLLNQLQERGTVLNDVELEYGRDDDKKFLLLNAHRLKTTENGDLILLAFEDITERKRASEARYRRLFESAHDGIVIVDAGTGEIIDINPYVEQLFGYSRGDTIGRKLWEAEPLRDNPRVLQAFEQIRDQGVVRFPDMTLHSRDGREIVSEVVANIYSDANRRSIQFNIRDLTERMKFERELQHTQKLESLGLLAGGIAHDFNNLLTGILGNASLAYADTPADQPTRPHLRGIITAAERAAHLTRQMLAYAGKGNLVTMRIDLGDLIREILSLIRTSIPKNVVVNHHLASGLPPINGDPGQIQQLIMNLAINGAEAIDEGKAGKVEIRTEVRQLEKRDVQEFFAADQFQPGSYVRIEVTDNGSGMDEATKNRIFDPFFTTKFTGRGLGLAAVLGIVRSHRGAIRVYSTPGHGTSFQVMLPAASPVAVQQPSLKPLALPANGATVLVIDDEELIRNLARAMLERHGLRVLIAENGKTGVEILNRHKDEISAVLLDLQMPVMGGEEALDHIKQIKPDVPVILSSGYDESEASRRFAGKELAGFVQKPYDMNRLIAAVSYVLQSSGP